MPNNPLQFAKEALAKAIEEKKKNQELIKSLGPAIVDTLKPVLSEIASNSKLSKDELLSAISGIQINVPKADVPQAQVEVKIPEIKVPTPQVTVNVPDIKVPEIKVPAFPKVTVPKPEVTVNVPEIKIPKLSWPEGEMDIKGWVKLQGVSLENPLPVQLRDASGKPVNLDITNIMGGGSGGRGVVKVSGFDGSAYSILQNGDGRLKVSVETGGSGLTDSELRATSLTVNQLSGSNWSVTSTLDSTNATTMWNADNRLRVSLETGGSGLTDSELRASRVYVEQVSGANWSTEVTNTVTVDGSGVTQPVSATNLDIRDLVDTSDSVRVYQLSGASWSVAAALDSTSATSLYNADNRLRVSVETGGSGLTDSELRATAVPVSQLSGASWSTEATQSGTWNIGTVTTVTAVTDVTNSIRVLALPETIQTQLADITTSVQTLDNAISGNEMQVDVLTMPTVTVTGSLTSVVATGSTVADAVDDGSAPVQIGGIARQANPTAVSGGDVVKMSLDDLGRQITRPVQVRDLIATAFVTLTDSSEDTLIAGVASTFLDLIYVLAANESDAAVNLAFRSGTGGSTMFELEVQPEGTTGVSLQVPIPSSEVAQAWTVQNTGTDVSGTTVNVSALFSKEI